MTIAAILTPTPVFSTTRQETLSRSEQKLRAFAEKVSSLMRNLEVRFSENIFSVLEDSLQLAALQGKLSKRIIIPVEVMRSFLNLQRSIFSDRRVQGVVEIEREMTFQGDVQELVTRSSRLVQAFSSAQEVDALILETILVTNIYFSQPRNVIIPLTAVVNLLRCNHAILSNEQLRMASERFSQLTPEELEKTVLFDELRRLVARLTSDPSAEGEIREMESQWNRLIPRDTPVPVAVLLNWRKIQLWKISRELAAVENRDIIQRNYHWFLRQPRFVNIPPRGFAQISSPSITDLNLLREEVQKAQVFFRSIPLKIIGNKRQVEQEYRPFCTRLQFPSFPSIAQILSRAASMYRWEDQAILDHWQENFERTESVWNSIVVGRTEAPAGIVFNWKRIQLWKFAKERAEGTDIRLYYLWLLEQFPYLKQGDAAHPPIVEISSAAFHRELELLRNETRNEVEKVQTFIGNILYKILRNRADALKKHRKLLAELRFPTFPPIAELLSKISSAFSLFDQEIGDELLRTNAFGLEDTLEDRIRQSPQRTIEGYERVVRWVIAFQERQRRNTERRFCTEEVFQQAQASLQRVYQILMPIAAQMGRTLMLPPVNLSTEPVRPLFVGAISAACRARGQLLQAAAAPPVAPRPTPDFVPRAVDPYTWELSMDLKRAKFPPLPSSSPSS